MQCLAFSLVLRSETATCAIKCRRLLMNRDCLIHGITKNDVDSYIREFPIAVFKYYYELRLDDVFA